MQPMRRKKKLFFLHENIQLSWLYTEREVNGKNMDKSKRIEKTEEFIVAYEFELCLWDIRHPEYKNRDLKQAAIERLAGKFEISGT